MIDSPNRLKTVLLLHDDSFELTLSLLTHERLSFQLQSKRDRQIYSETINMNESNSLEYWGWFQNAEIAFKQIEGLKEDMITISSDYTVVMKVEFKDAPTYIVRKLCVNLKKRVSSMKEKQSNDLELRVIELERYMINLTKSIMKMEENHEREIQILKKEKDTQISLLKEELNALSINQQLQSGKRQMRKHPKLRIVGNKLFNSDNSSHEIRWALIDQALPLDKSSYLVIKINKLSWFSLGIGNSSSIRSRSFARLNGKGQHGSHMMDSNGWIYAQCNNLHNYKPLGFEITQGDVVTVKFDPQARSLSFCNQNSLKTYTMYLQSLPLSELLQQTFCLACSSTTEVSICEKLERPNR